jgi:hypothetical protein
LAEELQCWFFSNSAVGTDSYNVTVIFGKECTTVSDLTTAILIVYRKVKCKRRGYIIITTKSTSAFCSNKAFLKFKSHSLLI